jgi:mannose-6-phosphate isomerase-like protein (cupin superfamily)
MVVKTEYMNIEAYSTKDGSPVRELFHPDTHENRNQSLAEAIVPVGFCTFPHRHHKAEEIYHILEGEGQMSLGNDKFNVVAGDTVCIRPGEIHCIKNTAEIPLKILCCSSPPYSHEDTEVI